MPDFAFNRLDLETRKEELTEPTIVDTQFLHPTFDHKRFASEHFARNPNYDEEPNRLPILYAFTPSSYSTIELNDEGILAFLYSDPHAPSDALLNNFQGKELVAAIESSHKPVLSSWEHLMDRAVSFLSQVPLSTSLEEFNTFPFVLAMGHAIPDTRLYISLATMLLPALILRHRRGKAD